METIKSEKILKTFKTSLNYPVVGFVDPLFVDPKIVQNHHFWRMPIKSKPLGLLPTSIISL